MLQIAIVDDEMIDLVTTEAYLRRHMEEHYPEEASSIRVDTFSRAEDIIAAFEPGMYDLLILDIYMEVISGMQAAQVIRERDREVSIVFLTSSEEHMLEGYRVFADGYFMKPLSEHEEDFAQTFRHIFPKLLEHYKELTVHSGGLEFSVPYRNISYIDIDWRHQLCLHLLDQDLSISMSYDECRNILLEDERFLECHHRILVNMDTIKSMGKEDFLLQNGRKIPISQRKQKEAKAKYMHYLVHR